MEILGKVKMIGVEQQVSPTFKKRELVVTTLEQYPQHILIEFANDKCDLLNYLRVGGDVRVAINLRGREWVNTQGETRYFNSIQGWQVNTPQQFNQQNQQQQNQPNYNQPQQGGGYHGTGSAADNYFAQNQQNNGFPPAPNFNNNQQEDDLPF